MLTRDTTRSNAVILTLRMLNLKLHGLKLKTKEARILYVIMFIGIHTIIVRIFSLPRRMFD